MPNSVLWVGLVAIWLFVLVPMFIKGRPEVAKTTDAVRQTRLLTRGGSTRRSARSRVSAGAHPHDASYRRTAKATMSEKAAAEGVDAVDDSDHNDSSEAVAYDEPTVEMRKAAAVTVDAVIVDDADEVDSDDVVTEDDSIVDAEFEDGADDETQVIDVVADGEGDDEYDEDAEYDDEYEEVDEYEDQPDYDEVGESDDYDGDDEALETFVAQDENGSPSEQRASDRPRGRGGYNPDVDRTRGDARYRERQRVLIGLMVATLAAVGSGVMFGLFGWIATGVAVVALLAYLAYLRRAVRSEAQIRKQRMARLERSRRDADERRRREIVEPELAERIPRRLRRPGSVVLEIDDEDPVFEHLPPFQRRRVMREDDEFRRVG